VRHFGCESLSGFVVIRRAFAGSSTEETEADLLLRLAALAVDAVLGAMTLVLLLWGLAGGAFA